MAVEYSEIMAGAAMFYTNRELDFYTKDSDSLLQFLKDAHITVSSEDNVVYGANKQAFIKYMDQGKFANLQKLSEKKKKEYLTNAVQGISAAQAIKKWLSSTYNQRSDVKAEKIFITGNKWPKEVAPFRVDAFGFDDYNSSDIIIKTKGLNYFGVSLKKKPKENSADPTLINKAFDTVLQGPRFDKIKKELTDVRVTYFAGLVRQAHEDGILYIPNIDRLPDEELFSGKNRDKKIFKRPYPNTKGSLEGGYDNDKAPDAMRSFTNKELAKQDNILFKMLIQVMDANSDVFADSLINLVLKTNLYDEIAARNLGKYTFGFALVTGIGEIKRGQPFAYDGKALDLHTILDGLSQLKANKEKYKITVDVERKAESTSAKTYFSLSKKGIPILNLELRYKGDKTPQPQFLGTISKEFISILRLNSLVKRDG